MKQTKLTTEIQDNKLILRVATPQDAIAIFNIYTTSRKELVSFAPLKHSEYSIYKWILNQLIATNQVIVAVENGIIVEMMAVSQKENIGWIDHLYIFPTNIRCGIGSVLINKAKNILDSPIRLYTFQENITARNFYERHGFEAIEFSDGSRNEEHCPDMLYEWVV